MSEVIVKYTCNSRLACANSLPANVIICLPTDKVLPISGVPVGFIEGQLLAVTVCPKPYNCVLYTYSISYESAQLAVGESIDTGDIEGVFCEGCMSKWIRDEIAIDIAAGECGRTEDTPCENIWTTGDLMASRNLPGVVNPSPLGPIGRPLIDRQYIIQFGGPATATYIAANIGVMEATPFDGLVTSWRYTDPVHGFIDGFGNICKAYPIPYALLAPELTIFQSVPWVKFNHNFMRLNIAAAFSIGFPTTNINNYADVCAYLNNIGVVVRMAKEAWYKGVLIDTEHYNQSGFWSAFTLDPSHTFAEYQVMYRTLGRMVAARIESEFPGCPMLCFPNYDTLRNGPTNLALNNYGLLPSFLDGMHDELLGTAKLVNATELGYGHQRPADFDFDILVQTLPTVPTPVGTANYNRAHEDSISTWIDYPGTGFNFSNVNLNYNTPAQFTFNIVEIAKRVPQYIVVYNQTPRWWNYTAGVNQMPYAYVQALGDARTQMGIGGAFDITTVPGIRAYYNPFDLSLNDNDPVALFPDSIGANDLAQTNPAFQPVYKANGFATGIPSVRYVQASTQFLENTSLAAYNTGTDKPFTMVAVTKFVSNSPGTTNGIGGFKKVGNTNTETTFGISSAPRWFCARRNDVATAFQLNSAVFTTVPPLATTLNVVSYRFDGVNGEMSINGTVNIPAAAQFIGALYTPDTFVLGRVPRDGVTQYLDGDLGPFVFCDQYLTTADYISLIRYIGFICGITIPV